MDIARGGEEQGGTPVAAERFEDDRTAAGKSDEDHAGHDPVCQISPGGHCYCPPPGGEPGQHEGQPPQQTRAGTQHNPSRFTSTLPLFQLRGIDMYEYCICISLLPTCGGVRACGGGRSAAGHGRCGRVDSWPIIPTSRSRNCAAEPASLTRLRYGWWRNWSSGVGDARSVPPGSPGRRSRPSPRTGDGRGGGGSRGPTRRSSPECSRRSRRGTVKSSAAARSAALRRPEAQRTPR